VKLIHPQLLLNLHLTFLDEAPASFFHPYQPRPNFIPNSTKTTSQSPLLSAVSESRSYLPRFHIHPTCPDHTIKADTVSKASHTAKARARTSTDNRTSKVATKIRNSIEDNKTPMAQANSSISRAMVNSRLVMGKTHMASSLRIKVRTKNITRSIMTATHPQQGTVASNKVMASNSNTASNKAMASNSSTDSTTKAPILAQVDLQLDPMAAQRETVG
jgi:hypothetical protein